MLTKWGEGISLSSGNICCPQSFTLEETALGHLEMGSCRRLGGCLRSVQQGAQWAAALRPSSPSFCLPPMFSSRRVAAVGFSPHFVAPSLAYPTVSYTVEGLTHNTFLKACVREYNCSNECMFDCFINF